ncbi:hypothetical protein GPL15_19045 [Clostridium sp. MCC353]|uniref:GTPase domain-containing protein n=1 Tax=Clostridium sp. MCC353 TaxID=2592646 RepID=UPI001C035C87|nr:GTPase domain-containing protein [Clostridium sp. MCC353]MBT9778598.1 hypothetical protein [Clostridium sp. MCC353]
MELFEKLLPFAADAGCEEAVNRLKSQAEELLAQEDTHVVVAGGANSGKTTLINRMVGNEVREESLLNEEEKPLRVVFEKRDDDDAYDCRTVMNQAWYDEGAVLYEMKIQDMFCGESGALKEVMNTKDIVLYMVSAISPFTYEDVNAIKAMSGLSVRVFLNKLELIDEESRGKVEKYVQDLCENMGLSSPVIPKTEDWDNMGKLIRNLLPGTIERNDIRKRHVEAVYKSAVGLVEAEANKALAENQLQLEKTMENHISESLDAHEKQSKWGILRADMLENGDKLSELIKGDIQDRAEKLGRKLFDMGKEARFSDPWLKKTLPKETQKALRSLTENLKPQIEIGMRRDTRTMMDTAVQEGLVERFDLSEPDFMAMTQVIHIEPYVVPEMAPDGKKEFGREKKSKEILIGTGAALGLFLLIPLPTVFSVAGGAAAVGIGGAAYLKEKGSWEDAQYQRELYHYAKINCQNLADAIGDSIRNYYDKIAAILAERGEAVKAPEVDQTAFKEREQRLQEIIDGCQELIK